ncbi:MAG: hypothetical protein INF91_06960, partial [Alphaproteobacteria bacterium]|nr:hypothetical protein [Alphaproteobacteria bacterium]
MFVQRSAFGRAAAHRAPAVLVLASFSSLLAACGGGSAPSATGQAVDAAAVVTTASAAATGGGGASTGQSLTPEALVSVSVNGVAATPALIDTITTRSGQWLFSDLGAVGSDMRAYLWQLDGNDSFARVMICRRMFTKEAGDTTSLSVVSVPVRAVAAGATFNWTLGVAQGACRVAQTKEPVAPNAAWLREAVAAHLMPAYRRERAWLPSKVTLLALDSRRGAYNPASLGPSPG